MALECPDWELDPPPHDSNYFSDHLVAAHNYWAQVSQGQIIIDTLNSHVYPASQNGAYVLPHDMLYYHPYLQEFDETTKLFELSRDAIALADPDIDFNAYSTVILVHAGMGGDFAFVLDPTPGNIPSAYLSDTDFTTHGVLQTDERLLDDLIIIPESQNFQQYAETIALFADAEDPCFYQVALNGTLALMLGFHFDLPALYNTESGRSLVGGFALMDQGSNNFHGIVPAYPDPYTRIQAGWGTAVVKNVGDHVNLNINDPPVRISISASEYYLIENRQRNLIAPAHMGEWIDGPGYDTVSVITGNSGVVVRVDEQSAGLPGNGLNIWHIDESAWFTEDNPNGGPVQWVDFVEADGAQDMGQATQLLFADYLETGWWFDTWFAGNAGYYDLNRYQNVNSDSLLTFGPKTFPATISNYGIPSHLSISNISKNGSTMSFTVGSDRVMRVDSISSIIGWGDSEVLGRELWGFNVDSSQIVKFIADSGRFVPESVSLLNPDSIFQGNLENSFTFRSPWIVPSKPKGVTLFAISSGYRVDVPQLDSLFELSVQPRTDAHFFAKQGENFVSGERNIYTNQVIITPLEDRPHTSFLASSGFEVFYGLSSDPAPAGVRHRENSQNTNGTNVVSWSAAIEKLVITHLGDGSEEYLKIEKPLHIIPLDADDDGSFEIALFYPNIVKIINQSGVVWNGSSFGIESYYGNPLIGTFVDGQLGIFLRHANHYAIYTFDGEVKETGVLPHNLSDIENSSRIVNGTVYVLSGQELLYFDYETLESVSFWIDPQGSISGDRIALLQGLPANDAADLKKGSAFNYPNPVKGRSTTIRAWLGDVDEWSIEIFSLNGAQVGFVALDVEQQNSYNEWTWDTSDVSNGVYLTQVSAGGKSDIIKIAVIR